LVNIAHWAREAGSWFGLVRIHNPGDIVYARPSNVTLPWITIFKHDAVIHKSYLTWVDFRKLQANEYIQIFCKKIKGPIAILTRLHLTKRAIILCNTVKIKGPVVILTRLSLTKRTIIFCLAPLGIVYVICKIKSRILDKCKDLMSIEAYDWVERAVELIALIPLVTSAVITLLALHILLNHAPGICNLHKHLNLQ
jgi:hypothetical protein